MKLPSAHSHECLEQSEVVVNLTDYLEQHFPM
jgi:hypothetical protein